MGRRLGAKQTGADTVAIRRTVKLKLTQRQRHELERWLDVLTGVYNQSLRLIEADAKRGVYHTSTAFVNLFAGAAQMTGVPSQVIQGTMLTAWTAWRRCFDRKARRPRLKSKRNRLNSIPFPDRTKVPEAGVLVLRGFTDAERASPRARIRYKQQHAQTKQDPTRRCMIDALPKEALRGCRIMKRASGWYASIVVEAPPAVIPEEGHDAVGIDPGYTSLLTLSNGETVAHPKELQRTAKRLAQAQRGGNKQLAARLHERAANQRRDRNHKLSRELLKRFAVICMSQDNLRGLARGGFGKSVASAGHGQLRQMLATKSSRSGGSRVYVDVPSRGSTRTCSSCAASAGPSGRAGLKVRRWTCVACGSHHDRDVNAAVNTLIAGGGQPLEGYVDRRSAGVSPPLPAAA